MVILREIQNSIQVNESKFNQNQNILIRGIRPSPALACLLLKYLKMSKFIRRLSFMKFNASILARSLIYGLLVITPIHVLAHGDVTPHAVDTSTLPTLGDEWRKENPYRGLPEAIRVGGSAYAQNCARCHGLDAISGGMSPDLRKMDDECLDLKDEVKKQSCYRDVD